jgi:hypothetical protein
VAGYENGKEREMDNKNSGQREKFPEPRGWAMNWVIEQEITAQLAELEQASVINTGKKFAQPRGWAMEWDGFALSEAEKQWSGNE